MIKFCASFLFKLNFRWQHPVIFVKDLEPLEMEFILQFIYRAEVDVPYDKLEKMVEIAKELGIVG